MVWTAAEVVTLEGLTGSAVPAVLVGHVEVGEVALSTADPLNLRTSPVLLIVAVIEVAVVILEVDIVRVVAAAVSCSLPPRLFRSVVLHLGEALAEVLQGLRVAAVSAIVVVAITGQVLASSIPASSLISIIQSGIIGSLMVCVLAVELITRIAKQVFISIFISVFLFVIEITIDLLYLWIPLLSSCSSRKLGGRRVL